MLNRLSWRPELQEFLAQLHVEQPLDPGISRFSRGIDNTRIDVALSPRFIRCAHLWIRAELTEYTIASAGGRSGAQHESHLTALKEAYAGMMSAAVDLAKLKARPGMVPLLQFGVMKFLLQLLDREIERLKSRMQRSREDSKHRASERAVEIHERLVALSKEGDALRYRVIRKLVRELMKLEEMSLSKMRMVVLEVAWPVPKEVLFNPMLQLPSVWADEQWMKHYPLAFSDWQEAAIPLFARFNRLVTKLFQEYLPVDVHPPKQRDEATGTATVPSRMRRHRRQGGEVLNGMQEVTDLLAMALQKSEYQGDEWSWLDSPENMALILNSVEPRRWLRVDPCEEAVHNPWSSERWPEFHHHLLKSYFTAVRKAHIGMQIAASYAAPKVYRQLKRQLPVRVIYHFLSDRMPRRVLLKRLRAVQPPLDLERSMQILDAALQSGKHLSMGARHRQMLGFLQDFMVLRRDLKQVFRAYRSMNGIRVLTREADLELSRGNRSLNEFVLEYEQRPEQSRIRSHVVLKADVRGSTKIIRELRKRQLNPASHFSLNFFQPINKLLEMYGARKTFVEGDAVILSLFELEDKHYRWLCVSLACGLASKILQVVDEKNIVCRNEGLPELELGLGIAFLDEAPTFLSDEDREIMISPAINRADQLSSCSALLRKSVFGRGLGRGVEVVAASGLPILEKESSDRMMRYNVNGIELDTPAFVKLQSELAMQVVRMDEEIYPGGARFYVGKYADLKGTTHWLVVREAPVRVWTGGAAGEGEQYGHRFYQVVSDPEVIRRVTESPSLSAIEIGYSKPEDAAPPPTGMHFGF